jgi:hypothetical protein
MLCWYSVLRVQVLGTSNQPVLVRKVPGFASPVDGKSLPICLVIDGTMNLELVDVCKINNKVFDYSPLLSDEAKESGWTRNPPGAFGGLGNDGHYRNVDFYTKSIQKSFLVFLEKKAMSDGKI